MLANLCMTYIWKYCEFCILQLWLNSTKVINIEQSEFDKISTEFFLRPIETGDNDTYITIS